MYGLHHPALSNEQNHVYANYSHNCVHINNNNKVAERYTIGLSAEGIVYKL